MAINILNVWLISNIAEVTWLQSAQNSRTYQIVREVIAYIHL